MQGWLGFEFGVIRSVLRYPIISVGDGLVFLSLLHIIVCPIETLSVCTTSRDDDDDAYAPCTS